MKILFAVATLLAAAIAAVLFPDMKKLLILIPFALLALTCVSGCSTVASFERDLRKLPDGHVGKVTISTTNLGLEARFTATDLDKQGNQISAKLIDSSANTPWLGKQSMIIEDWSADVSPEARAKRAAKVLAAIVAPAPAPIAPLPVATPAAPVPAAPAPAPLPEVPLFNATLPPTPPTTAK